MLERLGEIEVALEIVQKTLDALTARGDDEAAFELARAQYAASIRDSWPGNLGKLVGVLERMLANDLLKLTDDERENLRKAQDTFRKTVNE
ncbi:MAG: hypothetical protein HY898_16120 [Deltaproteobacteria bacterium]|nr:hypothetical protein [Deltaproteobacteria bacterium]